MLPPDAIKEFREIYLKIYGIELLEEEAVLRANNLVTLYQIVLEDKPQVNNYNEYESGK
jgi:hypothetical protein